MQKPFQNRNQGIEMARILAMIMIVTLHCLGHGGILASANIYSINYNMSWLIEIICLGAVNIYGIITGYANFEGNFRVSRILKLWIMVMFYCVALSAVNFMMYPNEVNILGFVGSFFPVLTRRYWYFTSYVCLFFFIPYLNRMLIGLERKVWNRLIILGFLFLSVLSVVGKYLSNDLFSVSGGYSFVWLAYLYIIGAYVRKYQNELRIYAKKLFGIIFLSCVGLTWVAKLILPIVSETLLGVVFTGDGLLLEYNAPLILSGAVAFVIFFSLLDFKRSYLSIKTFAGATFGVYIFSENAVIRDRFILNRFVGWGTLPITQLLVLLSTAVMIIYLLSTTIDLLRAKFFELIHIDRLCTWICREKENIKK